MKLRFVNGKAQIKEGRKVIAKIYDRNTFFKGTRYENTFKQFPYSVEMLGGVFECASLNEAISMYEKYKVNETFTPKLKSGSQ